MAVSQEPSKGLCTARSQRYLQVGSRRKTRTARSQRNPASLRIGHAIPGVDALLFGQCRSFLFRQRRRFVWVAGQSGRGAGVGCCERGAVERPALPDRKGIPHPCGSATPSLAWTLCSSGSAGLSCSGSGVALSGLQDRGGRGAGAGGCERGAVERPALPDRKGIPHPCGSATPSLAWTLCSSGSAGLSCLGGGVVLCGLQDRGGRGAGAGGCERGPFLFSQRRRFSML